jgi:hypothetical protein
MIEHDVDSDVGGRPCTGRLSFRGGVPPHPREQTLDSGVPVITKELHMEKPSLYDPTPVLLFMLMMIAMLAIVKLG